MVEDLEEGGKLKGRVMCGRCYRVWNRDGYVFAEAART
jgi:hypothetical protein